MSWVVNMRIRNGIIFRCCKDEICGKKKIEIIVCFCNFYAEELIGEEFLVRVSVKVDESGKKIVKLP